jgi:hypothetical protein
MTIRSICILMLAGLLHAASPCAMNTLTPEEKKDGFSLLFNGYSLEGWDGDPVRWTVQNGAILGSSDAHPFQVNTFLIHKGTFRNFILKGDIKLRNHNSGIQFRSEQLPCEGWMVKGYQADASEVGDEKSAWGNLYEERLRGRTAMKNLNEGWLVAKSLVHQWRLEYVRNSCGRRPYSPETQRVITLNLHDSASSQGIMALQLHAGPEMRVEFRNLKLKTLP